MDIYVVFIKKIILINLRKKNRNSIYDLYTIDLNFFLMKYFIIIQYYIIIDDIMKLCTLN